MSLWGDLYPVLPRENQSRSYIVKREIPSLTKVGRENIQVCLLETGRLVGGVISIRGHQR